MWTIGDKTVRIPLIQGGMGVGISLGGLAGAVAAQGGVGVISSAQIGFREKDFDRNPGAANLRAMEKEMKRAREISPDGIIGYNIMVALRDYEAHVKAAAAAGADLIISGAGLPTELPRLVKGFKTKIAPIVSTEKSAKVILKYWDRKYGRTADLVVIEGPEAGGHLGFDREALERYTQGDSRNACPGGTDGSGLSTHPPLDYLEEIRRILEAVRGYEEKYGKKIPVVAAGGIYDRRDVQRVMASGVDGVQVASRFVTTEECDADVRYKEAYLRASKEEIVLVNSPVGMPGRAILNPFIKRVMLGEKIPHTPCHGCLAKCNPAEIPYCITDALIAAARGRIEEALLFCGAKAYRAKRIETVKEVVESLL